MQANEYYTKSLSVNRKKSHVAIDKSLNMQLGSGLLKRDLQVRTLIAGTHRSGTTWLGRILEAGPDTGVLQEPFNLDSGIAGIRHWYAVPETNAALYTRLLDDLFLGQSLTYRSNAPGYRRLSYLSRLFYTSPNRKFLKNLRRSPPLHLIVKDPLASMAAEYFIKNYGFKTVFTVKHPCAFYQSLLRVGWEHGDAFAHLLDQYGQATKSKIWKEASGPAGKSAVVWSIINAKAIELSHAYPDQVVIVRHEDLCVNALEIVIQLTKWLGIQFTEEMSSYITNSVSGNIVNPGRDVVHQLTRDSANLPDRWRTELAAADIAEIRKRTSGVAEKIYPSDW